MSLIFLGSQLFGGHCAIDISIASRVTGNLRPCTTSIAHILDVVNCMYSYSSLFCLPSAGSDVCDLRPRSQLYAGMQNIASNNSEKHVPVVESTANK